MTGLSLSANHYTYGYHPDEMEYSIKTWSDETWNAEIASFYEDKFMYVGTPTVLELGEVRGLIKLKKDGKEKVMLSLFKSGVTDRDGRRGIYSHHITVDLEEYIKLGANPRLLEKYLLKDATEYVKFVRNAKSKGRADPIRIEIEDEAIWKYKVEDVVENVKSKNTLKNILAVLFKKERLTLLCEGRDVSTLIKIVYALLEFLPPKRRIIQFCTSPVIRNESEFELIVLAQSSFREGRRVINIDKEMDFRERDNVDTVVGHVVDEYFKGGSQFLIELHKLWERMESEHKDLEECARAFVYEKVFPKYGVKDLLNKAKEYLESARYLDAELVAREAVNKMGKIELKQFFPSAAEIMLEAADRRGKFSQSLEYVMTKSTSVFQREQQVEMVEAINKKFPDHKDEIFSYLEKVGVLEEAKRSELSLASLFRLSPPKIMVEKLMDFNSVSELQTLIVSPESSIFYTYARGLEKYCQSSQPDVTLIRTILDLYTKKLSEVVKCERHKLFKKELSLKEGIDSQRLSSVLASINLLKTVEDLLEKFGSKESRSRYELFKKGLTIRNVP